jgi:hypothetical protein
MYQHQAFNLNSISRAVKSERMVFTCLQTKQLQLLMFFFLVSARLPSTFHKFIENLTQYIKSLDKGIYMHDVQDKKIAIPPHLIDLETCVTPKGPLFRLYHFIPQY